MSIIVTVPVSGSLKKFLVTKFGDFYQPSQRHWLGILMFSLLVKKSNWETRGGLRGVECTEVYDIHLSLSQFQKHGGNFSEEKLHLLRKALESVFREHIYEQCILNKKYYGIDYNASMRNILSFYGVPEEDSSYYQALMRDFTRKREKILKGKNFVKAF